MEAHPLQCHRASIPGHETYGKKLKICCLRPVYKPGINLQSCFGSSFD